MGRGLIAALGVMIACAAPTGVEPASGAFGGGEPLRIHGEGFARRGPPVIYVCQRVALGVVIESDRLIRAITPRAEEAGPCPVTAVFGGAERVELGVFTYDAPRPGEADSPDPFGG